MDTDAKDPQQPGVLLDSSDDGPQKYIRTYQGDVETLKKGDIPDLTPLPEKKVILPPAPPPAPVTPSEPEEPTLVVPPPTPAPAPAPTPSPKNDARLNMSPISDIPPYEKIVPPDDALKTYSGDFLDRMKETSSSMATVLAAEQDAHEGEPQPEVQKKVSRMTLVYTIAGVLLLLIAGGGGYVAYRYATAEPVAVTPVQKAVSPILVDEEVRLVGSGTALAQAIVESVAIPLSSGTVRLLTTASSTAPASTTPETVLQSLKTSAPAVLLRNSIVSGSIAGVVNVGGSQTPFFILSVTSFGESFSGMLQWEPRLRQDMELLFPPYPEAPQQVSATSTGATSTVRAVVAPRTFVDETVANHDVRVYRDALGKSVILYGYWNPTTLIIARDPAAFTDLIGRLGTARVQTQ